MKVTFKAILLILLSVLLMAEAGLIFVLNRGDAPEETAAPTLPPVTEPPETEPKE